MRIHTLVFFFLLFFASAASAQTSRAVYCQEHPTDSTKCTAINATDNNGKPLVIGAPVVCGSAGNADKQRLSLFASTMEQMFGMNEDSFEQAGFCKLTPDEAAKLLDWHMSQLPERLYFRSDGNRPNKRIYVQLVFLASPPDILKSAARDAFRRLSDVELVDRQGDFKVQVLGTVPVTKRPGGTAASYAFAVNALALYRLPGYGPGFSDAQVEEQKVLLVYNCAAEDIDSLVREAVAKVDGQAFEYFRKSHPYFDPNAK